jgi:DNA-binding Xre family transcriptional regulator
MKVMRNNINQLLARKARRLDRHRISVLQASKETGISYYTLTAFVNNKLREYPVDVLTGLCDYLECNIGDLLSYEEISTATPDNS